MTTLSSASSLCHRRWWRHLTLLNIARGAIVLFGLSTTVDMVSYELRSSTTASAHVASSRGLRGNSEDGVVVIETNLGGGRDGASRTKTNDWTEEWKIPRVATTVPSPTITPTNPASNITVDRSTPTKSSDNDVEDEDAGGGGGASPDVATLNVNTALDNSTDFNENDAAETDCESEESLCDQWAQQLTIEGEESLGGGIGAPRILWGIASAYGSETETRRRNAIRESYLSFYRNNDHFIKNTDRVCSLADLMEGKVTLKRCQLVYTFFMGGNPNGPEELMEVSQSSDFLADRSTVHNFERDATYLNIKENQFGGKMQTWFAYANSLVKDGYDFHYVAKVDSDTLLYTPTFLSTIQKHLPASNSTRIYAGVSVSRKHCGRRKDEHCSKMITNYYMGGSVEMMSADLVEYIASLTPEQRRQLEITSHEDITIGNFVLSHPETVQKVELGAPIGRKVRKRPLWLPLYWRHDKRTKDPGKFLKHWLDYEQSMRQRDPTHSSVLLLTGSNDGGQQLQAAIKHRCATTKITVTERCFEAFVGKAELYISRLASDATSIAKGETWNGTIAVAIQNPINEHLSSWRQAIAPFQKIYSIRSKRNQDLLAQLRKNRGNKVLTVRAEHMWDDLLHVERQLGNPLVDSMKQSDWPGVGDPVVEILSGAASGKQVSHAMCCGLREELQAYSEILLLVQISQDSPESFLQSKAELLHMCQINSTDELDSKCGVKYAS